MALHAGLYSQIFVALLIARDRAGSEAAAEGKEVGLESTGITGVTALEAPHRPFAGTALFWNARVIGSSHAAKMNPTAKLLFFA